MMYIFSGVCAGIAGLMESSMIAAADPNNAGLNMEMDAILAVALGGHPALRRQVLYQRLHHRRHYHPDPELPRCTRWVFPPSSCQVCKAVVVILICLIQSEKFKKMVERRSLKKKAVEQA